MDNQNDQIGVEQHTAWCQQAAEAVIYVHARGVLHSDLRPGNYLVDAAPAGSDTLDLLLCDFGGSMCAELGLKGLALPSVPFYHPVFGVESSIALDIFGLGSVLYFILTGLCHIDMSVVAQESRTSDERTRRWRTAFSSATSSPTCPGWPNQGWRL